MKKVPEGRPLLGTMVKLPNLGGFHLRVSRLSPDGELERLHDRVEVNATWTQAVELLQGQLNAAATEGAVQ